MLCGSAYNVNVDLNGSIDDRLCVGLIEQIHQDLALLHRDTSACCGGGSKPEIPKKKLDGTKLGEKTMKITGMHCENCVASVTRAINRIDGAAAKVSLKKGEAVVSYDREISNEELKKVVEDRGYHVVSIQ